MNDEDGEDDETQLTTIMARPDGGSTRSQSAREERDFKNAAKTVIVVVVL